MPSMPSSRYDLLHSYLCFLEGRGLIDFATLRPFDFRDVVQGFAMGEGIDQKVLLEDTYATEEYDLLSLFSEHLDGDGIMLVEVDYDPAESPTHDDLVTAFLSAPAKVDA